jgi:hypothetical protein
MKAAYIGQAGYAQGIPTRKQASKQHPAHKKTAGFWPAVFVSD